MISKTEPQNSSSIINLKYDLYGLYITVNQSNIEKSKHCTHTKLETAQISKIPFGLRLSVNATLYSQTWF